MEERAILDYVRFDSDGAGNLDPGTQAWSVVLTCMQQAPSASMRVWGSDVFAGYRGAMECSDPIGGRAKRTFWNV